VTQQGKTRQRERAVAALLSQPTIQNAAEETGISSRTLKRWLNDPAFQDLYRAAKNELLAAATTRLRAAAGQAVTVLDSVANDAKATSAARVTAAKAILELALRAHELENQELRLAVFEAQGMSDFRKQITRLEKERPRLPSPKIIALLLDVAPLTNGRIPLPPLMNVAVAVSLDALDGPKIFRRPDEGFTEFLDRVCKGPFVDPVSDCHTIFIDIAEPFAGETESAEDRARRQMHLNLPT
jgi:hypothetical protein